MSQFITSAELDGLNEQELRAKYQQIVNDLNRQGKTAQVCCHAAQYRGRDPPPPAAPAKTAPLLIPRQDTPAERRAYLGAQTGLMLF